MRIVGDVHGKIKQYRDRIEDAEASFQVGDMGLGFADVRLPEMDKKHKFIRGNHDKPEACRNHPNYAGDYGYWPEHQLFYLGGAWSIDQNWRVEGVSWWRDEELDYQTLSAAHDLFVKEQPKYVITHDAPEKVGEMLVSPSYGKKIPTRTGQALQRMFETHQPRYWIFGHYHMPLDLTFLGTRFVCLNELETFEI